MIPWRADFLMGKGVCMQYLKVHKIIEGNSLVGLGIKEIRE